MRRVLGVLSAIALTLLFPFVLRAAFPSVATNTWSPAQSLTVARSGAATVMLQDGRLLITGGSNGNSSVASVDIVDTAGNITAGPPMNMARSQHTATVLQDGRVLVVGGVDVSGNPIGTAEIFDPSINAAQANPWTATGPLVQARSGQTATLLYDGTVLIAGGMSGTQVLSTLEVFDAASGTNGSFTMLPATLSSPRAKHAAALLEDGRVLVVGGWDGTVVPPQPPATIGTPHALASTDIYDPSARQVRAGPALNIARMSLTATTQLDGQVFVAGGDDGTQDLASTETFDPITSPQPATFTLGKLTLTTPRSDHLAILLPHNGGTLLVGGSSNGTAIASAELYMPVYLSQSETATLTAVPNAMSAARVFASGSPLSDGSATSVNDGLLLVAGGTDASGNALSSAEYFGFAWVKTDALEYAPGTPVNITGGGFQPGETVTLHLQELPYYDSPADMTAVAKADGTFSNSTFAPDTYDLNTGFFLTATGSASHYQAQTVFADSVQVNGATITVENAACSAGQTVFTQGDSVCANVAVTTNGSGASATFYVVWFNPSSTIVASDVQSVSGSTAVTDTLPTTGSSATGTWTVKACDASNCSTSGGKKVWDSKSFTVREATSTALSLTSGSSPSTYGDSLTFTATVSSGAGTPTGTVSFYDGGSCTAPGTSLSGPTALSSGKASFSVSSLSAVASPHTILACYAGTTTGFGPSGLSLAQAVNPKALSAQGTLSVPSSRMYDGTTGATISGSAALLAAETIGTGTSTDGKPFTGDAVSLTSTAPSSASYNSKDVGTASTVTFNGLSLTGVASGNYTLTAPTQAATIAQKALTYSGLTVAASKVYDGTTNATVSGTAVLQPAEGAGNGTTADGKPYSVDSVSVTGTPTGSYNSKDVLTATTVTFGGESLTGTGSGNYTLTTLTQSATITPKALTYSGLTVAASKVYDATTNALVSGTAALQPAEAAGNGATADGKPYSVDSVSLTGTATATYDSKDVATASKVTFGGLSLTGGGSTNYSLTAFTQSATITPKALTYSGVSVAASKVYDATTNALVSGTAALQAAEGANSGSASDGKPYSGDAVSLTGTATGTYNSKDAATANTVTFGGVSLTGTDSGDYTLTAATQPATITAKALTYTGLTAAASRIYDATTAATVSGSAALQTAEAAGSGSASDGKPYSGDGVVLTGTATGTYNSKDVATANTVTFGGVSLTGTDSGDYTLTAATQSATITAKALTITGLSANNKTYDGTTNATLAGNAALQTAETPGSGTTADGEPYSGDGISLTGTAAGAFASRNAATGISVSVTGLSLSGAQMGDYSLTALSLTANITPATLTAAIVGTPTKTYDGTTGAVLTSSNFALMGLVNTETFTVTQIAGSYNSPNVASATTITASLSPGDFTTGAGTLASNYSLPTTASGPGTISKADATIAVTPYTITYDGNTHTATGTVTGVKSEALAGLDLSGTTHTNAGGYSTDKWTFTDSTGNYNNANGTVDDAINKANPTVSVTPYTVTYDGNTHTATGTATGVKGEALAGLDLSGTTHTNAGTFASDAWTFNDSTGNYNNANGTVADVINKANATVSVTPYTVTYDGNAHTATGTATGVKGEPLAGLDLSGTAHTNAGGYSTDKWTFTDVTGNYDNANGTVDDVISKANPTVNVTPYTVTYDGNTHTATGSATGVKSEALAGLDLSGTTHTNAGTFASDAWTFTDSTGNYNNANGTVADVINKANATVSVTPYTVTYDGNAHTATGTVTGVKGEPLAGLDLSGTAHTNAGSYNDNWAFTDTTGNYNNVSGNVSDAIAKANAAITVSGYGVTYDGNAHTATGSVLGVKGESLSGLDLSKTTRTNAGTSTDPWTFTDSTGNYNNASGTVQDAIAKANAKVTVTGYSLSYDGSPHTDAGSATGVKGESLSGLDLSKTTRTNAGTTTDPWMFTDSTGNYNDASGTVEDVINKANATISVTAYSVIYNGTAHTASGTATGVLNEDLSSELNLSGTTHTNAGSYSDTWSFTDVSGNYNNTSNTITDVIGKADPKIAVSPYTVTYNGASHTATGTATGVVGEDVTSELSLAGTAHSAAGTYTDTWSFNDTTGNYNSTSNTVTDTINKADAIVSVVGYNVTYDGNAHTATGSATGVNGETLSGLNLSGTMRTNAGTTTDPWTFTDTTGNYNNANGTVQDVISKANAAVNVTGYTVSYDTTSHMATGTVTGVKGESLSGLDLSGTAHTNAGNYNDSWSFTDATGNYSNSTGTVLDAISKVDAKVTVTAYGATYDGTAHTATGTATGVGGVSVAGLNLSGTTHTNAGNYSDSWTFIDPAGNYNSQNGTVQDAIARANATVMVTPYSVTYDGNAHTAMGGVTGVGGAALTGLDLSGTTHTSAGSYTDTWTFTDSTGNYNNASGTTPDAIAKASATVSVTPYSVTYDGAAHTATGTATGVKGEALSGLNLSGTTHTNPGAYTDSWSFTDATGNYNSASGTVKDSINYGFLGLEAPYAPPPTTFNVQRTMPIVWQYTNARGSAVNSASANPGIQISGPYACGGTDNSSDITVTSAGNSGYQYDSTTNTWQFNWQVKGNQPGCYNIVIVNGQTGQTSGPFPISVVSH